MRGIVWIVVLGLAGRGRGQDDQHHHRAEGRNPGRESRREDLGREHGRRVREVRRAEPAVRRQDRQRGKLHEDLAPNATFEEELTIATGTLGEGRWPYAIAVDYADANLYPFQALLVATQVVGNPPPAKLSVPEIKSNGIAESGPLSIKFKNLAAAERDVTFRVIVPGGARGIGADELAST